MPKAKIDFQNTLKDAQVPQKKDFANWLQLVLDNHPLEKRREITVRIVENAESQELNSTYRGKEYPTNILSFPLELPSFIPTEVLGDLVIAKDVVAKEANEQNKPIYNHWAHLTIHGILHLLGYDHIEDEEAQIMESLEIKLLAELNIENPYENP